MIFGSKVTVTERLDALREAAERGRGILDPGDQRSLDAVVEHAFTRRALSAEHTVVGFFGATGSGKTSLFNAVVGENLGEAAARRPTTSAPLAAVWHPNGANELLDWLQVEDRRNREGDFSPNSGGLILLDLPDFDSIQAQHREIAARLAGQVDVLVWVTDPEKYADAIIHRDFIAPHAAHAAVTLAALNKTDKLDPADRAQVVRSLEELLLIDGLKNTSVIPTSALSGEGIPELRNAIAQVASAHSAQQARIAADIATVTATWSTSPGLKNPPKSAHKAVADAMAQAAGADRIAAATAAAYRKRLGLKTGWVLSSWLLRLRADPLKRLGLSTQGDETGVHRSSMPALDASARAVLSRGVRSYAQTVSENLPTAWSNHLSQQAGALAEDLPEKLERAVSSTRLPAQPSSGWNIIALLQWLALLGALVGVGWYLLVAFVPGGLSVILDDPIPQIEGWPIPTLLILGGLLFGIVLGLLSSVFGWFIGAWIRRRTHKALSVAVSQVAHEALIRPLDETRTRYVEFLSFMQRAART